MNDFQTKEDVQRLRQSLGDRCKLPEASSTPALIAVSGLPGSGKSYFCRQLATCLPFPILESDVMRRALNPAPTHSRAESERLFRACYALIEDLLRKGISIIFDATNLVERHREQLCRIADNTEAKLILVRVEAPPEVVQQRLRGRLARVDQADNSDADWDVYQRMSKTAQRILRNHFAVDTSRDIMPVINKIVREVNR
jgi:predicted kinase